MQRFVMKFTPLPSNTKYFKLLPTNNDILGIPRVESTKIEAMMRRISEKIFLYDSAQRAIVEDDIERINLRQQKETYLHEFTDQRDLVPRPLSMGQTRLSKYIRSELETLPYGYPTEEDNVRQFHGIARLLWSNLILRQSTYHVIVREMLRRNHPHLALGVLESYLMGHKENLNPTTFNLSLETAMYNNNRQLFTDLSKRIMEPKSKWTQFQQKFSSEKIGVDFCGDFGAKLLAEGFLKFRMPEKLDELVLMCKERGDGLKAQLLTVEMAAANRWKDKQRALKCVNSFEKIFNPNKKQSVRFLLMLRENKEFGGRVDEFYNKLSLSQRKKFDNLGWGYDRPYVKQQTQRTKTQQTQ